MSHPLSLMWLEPCHSVPPKKRGMLFRVHHEHLPLPKMTAPVWNLDSSLNPFDTLGPGSVNFVRGQSFLRHLFQRPLLFSNYTSAGLIYYLLFIRALGYLLCYFLDHVVNKGLIINIIIIDILDVVGRLVVGFVLVDSSSHLRLNRETNLACSNMHTLISMMIPSLHYFVWHYCKRAITRQAW